MQGVIIAVVGARREGKMVGAGACAHGTVPPRCAIIRTICICMHICICMGTLKAVRARVRAVAVYRRYFFCIDGGHVDASVGFAAAIPRQRRIFLDIQVRNR